MSITRSLEEMGAWLKAAICKDVKLKPMSPDAPQNQRFDYHLVEPEVHVLYVPSHIDRPPEMEATVPAIVLQLMESKDDLKTQTRDLVVRLSFTAWDPGLHGQDILEPVGEGRYQTGPPSKLRPSVDGWRDAYNFMDRALRVIENSERIGALGLKRDEGITFGNYEWQDAPNELYPFWLCWCKCTVQETLTRNRELEEYL